MITKHSFPFYAGLLLLFVATRIFTSVYYIEDFDSLNFATGAMDFNMRANQPHFPGYPVFMLLVKMLYWLTGSFAIAFSVIGGVASFVLLLCVSRLFDIDLQSRYGFVLIFLFFFNPALWLMGNRYMPDLGGVALLFAVLAFFKSKKYGLSLLLCGVLAGWRVSYLPFVLPIVWLSFKNENYRLSLLLKGGLGMLLWLIPMLIIVGWDELFFVAQRQIEGHFNDFGGSVVTEPDFLARITAFIENIWAFGLGGWWKARHWITLLVSIGSIASIIWAWRSGKKIPQWLWWCMGSYFVWVFFFQNVLYKSRHELPFLPIVLVFVYFGIVSIIKYARWWGFVLIGAYAVSLSLLTTKLVAQHTNNESSFSQLTTLLRGVEDSRVLYADALLIDFLRRQGVKLDFKEIGKDSWEYKEGVLIVGSYGNVFDRPEKKKIEFFHNRYVNKMHENLTLYVY